MSSLIESIRASEGELINALRKQQAGVDDRTGKGTSAEDVVEQHLLRPYLPPPFRCQKGAVVAASAPDDQSKAIDRIVYDPTIGPPLVYGSAHSIFPIESVAGLVEITMRIDARKLREDVERIAPIQNMRRRRYRVPVAGSNTQTELIEKDELSPRGFLIGLPDDPNWRPGSIANVIREAHLSIGGHVKLHGVYIIGIGCFFTKVDGERRYCGRRMESSIRLSPSASATPR